MSLHLNSNHVSVAFFIFCSISFFSKAVGFSSYVFTKFIYKLNYKNKHEDKN